MEYLWLFSIRLNQFPCALCIRLDPIYFKIFWPMHSSAVTFKIFFLFKIRNIAPFFWVFQLDAKITCSQLRARYLVRFRELFYETCLD